MNTESRPITAEDSDAEVITADLATRIHHELECKSPISIEFIRATLDNIKLFDKKQQDYGPKNISEFGTHGVLVRMNDKFARLKSLMGKRRRKPQNESIMDSFRDVSVYGTIAIMTETKKWPDV